MRLFTSSSDSDGELGQIVDSNGLPRFIRSLIYVLAIMLCIEIAVRLILIPESKDLSRYRSYSLEIKNTFSSPGMNVAFIGNSVTGECIDPVEFSLSCKAKSGRSINAVAVAANGSGIRSWYYMLRHYFIETGAKPDLLVFHHFGNTMLTDGEHIEAGRLAREFTSLRDWPEVFRRDVTMLREQCEFFLSYCSAFYAIRSRIGKTILGKLHSDVRAVNPQIRENLLNHLRFLKKRQERNSPGGSSDKRPLDSSASHLQAIDRLAKLCSAMKCQTIFIAYPTDQRHRYGPYTPDRDALEVLDRNRVILLDLQKVPELRSEDYRSSPIQDWIHLNKEGTTKYTDVLSRELIPYILDGKAESPDR